MKNQYHEWFEKAEMDGLSAKALLDNKEGHPNTVCFLAQQMVEKYLKGLLVFHESSFRKVHDLLELETMLMKYESDISRLHVALIFLNGFYVGTRYPGDYPEFSWEDARQAFEKALEAKVFVLEKTGRK